MPSSLRHHAPIPNRWSEYARSRWFFGIVIIILLGCRSLGQSDSLSKLDYRRLKSSSSLNENASQRLTMQMNGLGKPVETQTPWGTQNALPTASGVAQQAGYATLAEQKEDHHCLVLSGGGQYGAFSVGVLTGWTDSGSRPDFDVVTGISTGALIAPYAFLGAQYDPELQENYLTTKSSDIYNKKSWLTVFWDDSVADPKPLKQKIKTELTPELVELIAARHREGHRLYIGTTDLRRRKLVTWDIGAIAVGDRKDKIDFIRRLLLASCSVPGFFPPVAIEIEVDGELFTEYHVDGSVAASILLQPDMLPAKDSGQESHVHVIVAGNAQTEAEDLKHKTISLVMDALASVMQTRFELDLLNAYILANWSGASFEMTAVPEEINATTDMLSFSPQLMTDLFLVGQKIGKDHQMWENTVPQVQPELREEPRVGTRFSTQQFRR